jgi:hypothetical protein
MKGTLHKTEGGWQVWYHAKEDLFYGNTGVRILPIIDYGYVNGPGLSDSNEGQEVEFKVIEFPVPPTNGPVSNSISKYAQLIDKTFVPMKGGEGWDKILNKAIEDKAEDFTNGHYHYRGKDAFIHGYKQGQENTKAMRYTEEDMRELYTYAKRDDSNLEDYLQALNKQDSDWITMKEGDITVNFKPMPEFNEPISLLNSIRANPSWDTIIKEFHIATQQIEIGAPPLIFECWLVDNYNPPTKKQD